MTLNAQNVHRWLTPISAQGRLHNGENGARCTMAKIGGKLCDNNDAFARVYNNILLYE